MAVLDNAGLERFNNKVREERNLIVGASQYSSAQTYAVGDYAVYSHKIYRCKTAVSTAEAFDSSKWVELSIAKIDYAINHGHVTLENLEDSSDNYVLDSNGNPIFVGESLLSAMKQSINNYLVSKSVL